MKNFFLTIFVIVVLSIVGMAGYISYDYLKEKNSLQFSPIVISNGIATSTDGSISSTTDSIIASSVDRTSWRTYENDELGYRLKYPSDLIFNSGGMTLILAFPKKTYFRWPFEDDVKLTVVASSSCASQPATGQASTSALNIDNRDFEVIEVSDAGAGNVYIKTIYNILGNGVCYSLTHDYRGANGAGLYVNDPVLVKKYDEQHVADLENVKQIIFGILGSFEVTSIPEGQPEG